MPHVAGLILSSPFLRLKMPVPLWKRAAASVLSRLAPSFAMPSDIPMEWISHDKAIVEETRADPLEHQVATPRWFTETLLAQTQVVQRAGSIRIPVVLLYAGDDKIAEAEESERFFERLTVDKVARRYDGYYHEIFNEIGREAVFEDLESWLEAHR